MCTCVIFRTGFRDKAISLYSSKIVDRKEILHSVSNIGINVNAVCSSCEDMACCSFVQCTVQGNSSISETVRNETYAHTIYILYIVYTFLLRMTNTHRHL
jgi:hypothetical protein